MSQGFHHTFFPQLSSETRNSVLVAGTEKQHSNFGISGVFKTQPSQNLCEMDIPLQPIGKDIILGKVVVEKIILISNKKIPKDAIKYLQVSR